MARVSDTYGGGITLNNYAPNKVTEFDMIGKIAMQVIREVNGKNPLSEFEKSNIENGDTIEEAVIKLVESSAYDSTGANALARDTATKMAVRYYKNWTRKKYKTTVDIVKIRQVLQGERSASDVASKLVSVLGQSDIHDKYIGLKGLFEFGRTAGSGSAGSTSTAFKVLNDVYVYNGWNNLLIAIKNIVKGFTFNSTSYNSAGILRSANVDDIRIIMPYTVRNEIDVESLSGVFNLNKAEINSRIVEIDTSDDYIYIVDKNAILLYTRLYMMEDQKNADGLFWNYYLHVERLFAVSELFNGVAFKLNRIAPTE